MPGIPLDIAQRVHYAGRPATPVREEAIQLAFGFGNIRIAKLIDLGIVDAADRHCLIDAKREPSRRGPNLVPVIGRPQIAEDLYSFLRRLAGVALAARRHSAPIRIEKLRAAFEDREHLEPGLHHRFLQSNQNLFRHQIREAQPQAPRIRIRLELPGQLALLGENARQLGPRQNCFCSSTIQPALDANGLSAAFSPETVLAATARSFTSRLSQSTVAATQYPGWFFRMAQRDTL